MLVVLCVNSVMVLFFRKPSNTFFLGGVGQFARRVLSVLDVSRSFWVHCLEVIRRFSTFLDVSRDFLVGELVFVGGYLVLRIIAEQQFGIHSWISQNKNLLQCEVIICFSSFL